MIKLACAYIGSVLIIAAALSIGPAQARTYDIDIVHSNIVFFIDHLGFSRVVGVARDFGGSFEFDPAKPEASSLDVTVKVESIATNNKQRDSDIQGADWFNASEFPDITFAGTEYMRTGEKTGKIVGDLTIAGITQSATLDVTFNREGENPWDNSQVVGFSAETTIKRSDFGLKTALGMIGDDVKLYIEIEGRGR
ncbi:YceI family protein [Sinorhizobium americanum]|uniref:Polyisoprenoid-binding protein YceI n=1 Tax=Sinorhizobium americanum TaxID=194963 RepID=A0A4V2RBF9_9HYPH|nr:YceI family protein [Sinorhizobium americanum]TCN16900.1 polyisoprenoid-binding protein YceI [Sinorhizobium americanum]